MPQDLIVDLANEAQLTVQGLDQVPHDLWPAMDLPKLTWTDRLTIVLAGFGLTFKIHDDGRNLQLMPLTAGASIVRRYDYTLSQARLSEIVQQFPGSAIHVGANGIELTGSPDEHLRLQQMLERQVSHSRNNGRPTGTMAFTLKVEQQSVGGILQAISKRCELDLDTHSVPPKLLEQRVTFDVKEVELSELLEAVLTPVGLIYSRDGKTLTIAPR